MNGVPLFTDRPHPQLDSFVELLCSKRYFKTVNPSLLKNTLKCGTLLTLHKDEYLIREGEETPPELYIVVDGSLAVMSHTKFILRLEAGDVAGELSVISRGPRVAEVIAETDCQLIAFPEKLFVVNDNSETVHIFYFLFAHILAEKLRITTAQSLIRKNERVISPDQINVALIDENQTDRLIIRGVIESQWPEAQVTEFDDPSALVDVPIQKHFDLFIVDVLYSHSAQSTEDSVKALLKTLKIYGSPLLAVSHWCNDVMQRETLLQLGVDEVLPKPFSIFDLKHHIVKLRVWYYKQRELDQIEQDADTDRLTGLANRRRLDDFLEALYTIFPDSQQSFSLIISDVDNFKHYNDTQGHQMGDVVLAGVAAIFSQTVRKGDLASRFGGEEFVMILPNCDKDNAMVVAEKLRKAIEAEEFPFQDQQPLGNLTVTLGVATFPDDADNIDDLLKKADDCLYRGKEAGRNITIAAE